MTPEQLKTSNIVTSDSASIWLSYLPLKHERPSLTKQEFFTANLLRYGWELKRLPHECVCKVKYNIDHALTCKTGGFVTLRCNCHRRYPINGMQRCNGRFNIKH